MKEYGISFEIAGPAAIFTRPDSGASFVSYPAPTYSALKGMAECVARWKTAYIRPLRVEICHPIQFHRYATNYGGPLRKGNQLAQGASYQLFATILIDVCYKVHGVVSEADRATEGNNHLHALQEIFERRLKRGQLYATPCLGWSEFTPSYFGPLRNSTCPREDIDLTLRSMLQRVFDRDSAGQYGPTFNQDVRIEKGVLSFA
jgi:CRISPR-associated protein Cas5d